MNILRFNLFSNFGCHAELYCTFAENLEHVRSIQACSPCSPNFLRPNSIRTLAESYGLDMGSLSVECSLAKPTLLGKDMP